MLQASTCTGRNPEWDLLIEAFIFGYVLDINSLLISDSLLT